MPESETFDLAGQSVSTITNTIRSAFADPFPLKNTMIRVTFVTGAGKLGRQKYDEGAAKAVTSTLRELGFEEDRGASCVVECAGSFKLQHDTGKNLKTVVVFPNILGEDEIPDGMDDPESSNNKDSLLPENSPKHMIAMSSKNVFQRMVTSKCPAWSQKKGMVGAIDELKKLLDGLDAKLLSGTPLSDAEQEFYDSVSSTVLAEKEAFVKKEMQEQVEGGKLTLWEKNTLLKQVNERLGTIGKEIQESQGKPKKLEKLETMKEKAQKRKALLEEIDPRPPHPLRLAKEINKLRLERQPLQKMEEAAKGRLLSVKETQTLARKTEIDEEIASLEESSRGWFEDDDAFAKRVAESKRAFQATQKTVKKKKPAGATATTGKSASGFKTVSSNKWVTPGSQKKGAWGTAPTKKKATPKGGGVFAAMMMDSDSD